MNAVIKFGDRTIPLTPDLQALLDVLGKGRVRGMSFGGDGSVTWIEVETEDEMVEIQVVSDGA